MIKNYFFKTMFAAFVSCAVALGVSGCSSSNDNPGPDEDDAIEMNYAHLTFYTADAGANYYLKVGSAEMDAKGKVMTAGDIYYFDIYSTAPAAGAVRMPVAGTYTFDATNSLAAGTFTAEYSFMDKYIMSENIATPDKTIEFTEAKLVVTQSGKTFMITGEIKLESGEIVKIKSKAINGLEQGSTDIGDEVMMTGAYAEAGYLAQTGMSVYQLFIDGESEEDYASLVFFGPEATFEEGLPEGTFVIDPEATEPTVGNAIPGFVDEEGPFGCYYTILDEAYAYFSEGEIYIEKAEDGVSYIISAMGGTEDGKMIMVEYEGEVDMYDAGAEQSSISSAKAIKPSGHKTGTIKKHSHRILLQSRYAR